MSLRGSAPSTAEAVAALRAAGVPDVDGSTLTRGLYSSDASLYRLVPAAVVRPRHADEIDAVLQVARDTGLPVTMRGAGTSIAGNAVGRGIVVDTARHLGQVRAVDVAARTATVDPGCVHATLQGAVRPHGLRFGPDPSTHSRCTVGGMIGNNACGSRALGYGRTVDNVLGLDVVTGTGERLRLGDGGDTGEAGRGLAAVVDAHLATLRTEFGRFGRQVSGYALEHLLPERGRRLDRFLVGSEGTLAVVRSATVALVDEPARRALVVLGYPSIAEAADAVPGLLAHPLVACEGLDQRIVDVVRARRGPGAVPELPRGTGWLFAEVTGRSAAEVLALAGRVVADSAAVGHRMVAEPADQARLWQIREDGAGLAARSLSTPAHAGWEDAAVPPSRLGDYLRGFDDLLARYGYGGVPYGHFGDGCVHVRVDFGLRSVEGRRDFRSFVEDAADLVASYGGTLSGEHGDGRARSELLGRMYSPDALRLFVKAKTLLDPDGVLNPGVLVDPDAVDADLREAGPLTEPRRSLRLLHDGGSLVDAVHRCTGVGRCLADNTGAGGVMCPSYLATREEKDSTRGRARILQEMVDGRLVRQGWRSPEVQEALDLCLSCKGCATDCPTGVDMAAYKAEALYQRYRRRLRPRSHYTLGALPRWVRWAAPVAPVVSSALRIGPVQRVAKAAAGIDRRRGVPALAARPFSRWAASRSASTRDVQRARGADEVPDVVVWADSFTEHFATGQGIAAVRLLERAGLDVRVVGRKACCGLTWVSTGQLDTARRVLRRTLDVMYPWVTAGVPVVGLEPSCTAALRGDLVELLDDPRAGVVAGGVWTLAELLETLPAWRPPDLTGSRVVVQPHCHQHAVLGFGADLRLLARTGTDVVRVGGCCGLAGNFGVERGHYETSVAVAEQALLPAVREAGPDAVVLADGFSCRTQIAELAGRDAVHLAELLGPSSF